ncbi:MAG: UDP-glucose dehydrogenase family protein [Dehalococcoidia bacterium]
MSPIALKLCVAGVWHLGAVASACFADLGYSVVGFDKDSERVAALNAGHPPLHEPGLEELLSKNLARGRLRYTNSLVDAAQGSAYVLFTFDTPVDDNDEVELSELFDTATALAPTIENGATIIVSSQVPVGTCERLLDTVREVNSSARGVGIACVPENLRLGQAIDRFLSPDMIVTGSDDSHTLASAAILYAPIDAPKMTVDLRTAEMTKHAINTYLATCISFANELANLCDMVGADALKVVEALRKDARVSPKAPLLPGSGFSGGTLARDVKILRQLGREHGYPPPFFDGVWEANQRQAEVPVTRLKDVLPDLNGLTVAVLGLTYKPGTSTLRRSAALEVIKTLISEGANVQAYDPQADPQELVQHEGFTVCSSVDDAVRDGDAMLFTTPWPEFKELDFARLGGSMKSRVLVDAHNFLDAESLREIGFTYLGMGRSARPLAAMS